MCTDTPQRYLRRILVSDFKQTKRWPIIPSLRRCQCSPPPAYLSMCTDTPQRYLRRILILDFKQKNAGRPFSFQNRFSLLWQPCYRLARVLKHPDGSVPRTRKHRRQDEPSPTAICSLAWDQTRRNITLLQRNTLAREPVQLRHRQIHQTPSSGRQAANPGKRQLAKKTSNLISLGKERSHCFGMRL